LLKLNINLYKHQLAGAVNKKKDYEIEFYVGWRTFYYIWKFKTTTKNLNTFFKIINYVVFNFNKLPLSLFRSLSKNLNS